MTVTEVADRFQVSSDVVYGWINGGMVEVRRRNTGSPYLINIAPQKERDLEEWTQNSAKIPRRDGHQKEKPKAY